jgi:hypothetical protein
MKKERYAKYITTHQILQFKPKNVADTNYLAYYNAQDDVLGYMYFESV